MALGARLPDFPWDTLADAKTTAAAHPDGIVDLSVGTPVDPTPALAREALAEASDAHGYPTVWGTPRVRQAIIDYLTGRWRAVPLSHESVMPVVGTKELVGWLPTLLALGADHAVVFPECAYPTYEVGALTAGARPVPLDDPGALPADASLVWINSPANPTGQILSLDVLRAFVAAARERGAVLASDECYGEFAWEAEPYSVLDPRVNDGDLTNLLAVGSLSKRSNAAGYRAGFVAGDPVIVQQLVGARKHLGMMVPAPIQAAMAAMLGDQTHVEEQRDRYLARRAKLRPALEAAGFRIDHSEGSLYLWATRGENCRDSVAWLAERGILAAPGDFYGAAAAQHVRVALTATDERIDAAVARLSTVAE
ncbi:succinyldiaminopimelate transaminase [Tessaracoccus flavus]|uniref:Aminotransferase n=1 Tax=Tessaracoccus flavus TaxID=1610493 RepID=A0A1Q2CG87_9ACTN|nr:succinyldiaminopimelate transaminase [Tessaracoccus flavus]AQP45126.1 succinyldiaminopimelate transaminase [Tessaracoccus flavus]SDY55692.1 succinyldiaminopimelate aminotransferase apoenzyme [Tessaracoccus flavus]